MIEVRGNTYNNWILTKDFCVLWNDNVDIKELEKRLEVILKTIKRAKK